VTESPGFGLTVFVVILFNAALLGLETYSGLSAEFRRSLDTAEDFCLLAFTVEMAIRMAAHADRPSDFFRDPWNLFDLFLLIAAFTPLVRENATVLRLLRLARVLRTARFLPQLRILLTAVGRSLPGTLSFLFVGALILYVYAMIGWVSFADSDPQHYGSVGRAALTLFLLMTLDGIGDAVYAGLAVSRFSFLYYASYVMLASFVLVNVLIGVVLNSLDEAREMEEADAAASRPPEEEGVQNLKERIAVARRALDDLEAEFARPGGPRG
jgi:voltage-gated sodium channel